MRVNLSEIPEGGLEIEGLILPEEMDIHEVSFSIDAPVEVKLFLQIIDQFFIAKGSFTGTVSCKCDRCLKQFDFDPSRKDYVFTKEIPGGVDESIDLTEGVVEDILLRLPLKVICSEDCKGICPRCGADLNEQECTCKPGPENSPFSVLDKLL